MAVASRSQRSSNTVIKFTKLSLCPDVANSFVLAARVFTCRWVIKMAVLSSAKNDAQFSSSFFHLKNSSFESLSNSAAMLAEFCVTPTPAGKWKRCVRTHGCWVNYFCSRGCGLHPLPPQSSFPSVLVVSSLPVSSEVTFWHKAGNSLSARVDHVKACNRLEHIQRSGSGTDGDPARHVQTEQCSTDVNYFLWCDVFDHIKCESNSIIQIF